MRKLRHKKFNKCLNSHKRVRKGTGVLATNRGLQTMESGLPWDWGHLRRPSWCGSGWTTFWQHSWGKKSIFKSRCLFCCLKLTHTAQQYIKENSYPFSLEQEKLKGMLFHPCAPERCVKEAGSISSCQGQCQSPPTSAARLTPCGQGILPGLPQVTSRSLGSEAHQSSWTSSGGSWVTEQQRNSHSHCVGRGPVECFCSTEDKHGCK